MFQRNPRIHRDCLRRESVVLGYSCLWRTILSPSSCGRSGELEAFDELLNLGVVQIARTVSLNDFDFF
ncbi:hypothetical protein J6590_034728 [Homalodisca vitripennis]|nr:hypothetical protein J6590_034728 [Homalodisca vitripennis]